jgi:Uma2 family endonuclease
MSTLAVPPDAIETLADQLERLGNIPPERIRWQPYPGTATIEDMLEFRRRTGRSCELIDGILVEKAMGWEESILAALLIGYLNQFAVPKKLGKVSAPDGPYRLSSRLVRYPDVAFIKRDRLPRAKSPKKSVCEVVPNLAVEVLSKGNTVGELERKRREYFKAGVDLVWIVDPVARTVRVYTGPRAFTILAEGDTLDGGKVLPGFSLSVRQWFADAD